MVDVLTLNYNDYLTTINFVNSVKNFSCVGHVLIVDNKSKDDSVLHLRNLASGKVLLLENKTNSGYGAGNNLGIRYLKEKFKSKYILLANPDVIVDENTLKGIECFLEENQGYAIATPFMLNSEGQKQYNTAFRIPSCVEYIASLELLSSKFIQSFYYKNFEADANGAKNVGAVCGSMFMMNVDYMLEYGMFDERMFLYCEELVLGIKLRDAGCKIALLPNMSFVHNHSVSISKSYKSAAARHRLWLNSKLFVIKHYYKANTCQRVLAWILAQLSQLEVKIISFFRCFR